VGKKISILLLIFVATYMAAHFGIRWKNRLASEPKPLAKMINCEPREVRGVSITDRSGIAAEYIRSDTPAPGTPPMAEMADARWELKGKGEADSSALNRLASMACDFFAPEAPEGEPFKPASEGAQVVVWNITGDGAGEYRLEFGSPTMGRLVQGKLRKPNGEEHLLHMQPKLFQLASLPEQQQMNRRVARMLPDTVREARLLVGGNERFRLQREGADWRLASSGGGGIPASPEGQKFVNRVTTLMALETSFGACKMERPADLVVELEGMANRKEQVRFLRGKGNARWTACSSEREATFSVHPDIAKYIEPSISSLRL
jgi:hypothetical protein